MKNLSYSNAIRAFLCMLPMVFAAVTGHTSWIVPAGQGGFFNATLPLPKSIFGRLTTTFYMASVGLGFYLIGGTTAPMFWYAVIFAFIIGLGCGLLTGFRYLGMIAIAGFMPAYTAGLNAGSPEKATASFLAFAFVSLYSGLISLLPFWETANPPPKQEIGEDERLLMGIRLGLGASISLAIGLLFHFGKLGWAPSAVSSVIRTDEKEAKKRSWIRAGAVIGGAIIAMIVLIFAKDMMGVVLVAVILVTFNGLISLTPLGQVPLLYNAVILILYSQTSATPSKELIDTRILYNLIGVFIALAIVYYPLPLLTPKIKEMYRRLAKEQNHSS